MLTVTPTAIEAVKIIVPKGFADSRGVFCETYNHRRFVEYGVSFDFVQDNQSSSARAGTIRGLHFQSHPAAQDKLVRVLRGRILDVAVDLRRTSPTYGRWVAEELSADNGKQLLVPVGFAHGFCTLEPETLVLYKVTGYYAPAHDLGVAWNDPDLAIDWPVSADQAVLSEKDMQLPSFRSLPAYFE
ncbi:dTDP-4-dehydrorhamnose 3,5-epimerase [Rhodopseudomonas palustris HaA2]|uniref:dTDP-4-dehydrorhamnose 3,5-epimerase n=1 Tax=Rhodopseudomonas palustris (strain HaA2) TaxID=316058 RepID=Q2IZT7_RHOP2|nr:dTDP-4-dehydrorhamnose 3,5-epimerase [Rhodopseudomonas palustris]ABD06273.1 dTDP-4-dehydrorhamnose 3,5-epimerase [Rhodopseudomonas palustris HaA2]